MIQYAIAQFRGLSPLTTSQTRYIGYTDDTFTVKTPQPAWLGILGPVIRAEVGDVIRIHFYNKVPNLVRGMREGRVGGGGEVRKILGGIPRVRLTCCGDLFDSRFP